MKRPLAIHPLLFAVVPVLYLYAVNIRYDVSWHDAVAPLAITVASTMVVMAAAWLLLRRDALKAGLITTLLVVLFFTYGRLFSAIQGLRIAGIGVGRHLYLLPLWGALSVLGVVLIVRAGQMLQLTKALNLIAGGLILLNLASIGYFQFTSRGGPVVSSNVLDIKPGAGSSPGNGKQRDIYYLMFDEYGGARALKELFGYDNTPFYDWLRSRGFYVVDHATTNYPHTAHSLAASLNLQYVNELVSPAPSSDWSSVYNLMKLDAVPKFLRGRGYRYIHIGSWWTPTATNPQADVNVKMKGGLSEFTTSLVDTTVLSGSFSFQKREYLRVNFEFDQLTKATQVPGPKFVFGHVLIPHLPYIFDPTGHFVDDAERAQRTDAENYVRQLQYANVRVERLLDALLSQPEATRPIILLQSDEGPYMGLDEGVNVTTRQLEQHFGILNAFYLPGVTPEQAGLSPTITPVNEFRVVFNSYFDAGLPLLPDRNYVFRDPEHLYTFIDVTDRVRAVS
jgi:hypothetical protein